MASVVLPETTRALYPFKSHFLTLSDGKRMHYVDEGPEDGEILFFIHGYPTWSFLYRAFIVYYAARGFRCIALDHIGYGFSDKPTNRRYHTMRRHVANVTECIEALELHDITMVMEDWGGPLGLSYVLRRPENVKRLMIMNSWVFQETYMNRLHRLIMFVTRPGVGELLFGTLNLMINRGIQRTSSRKLSSSILAGYKAPFRDSRSRTALYQFPRMINTSPTHPSAPLMREIEQGLGQIHIPSLIVWGKNDPIFPPDVAEHWHELMPRAKGPVMLDAGHYVPEDAPEEAIVHLDDFLDKTG